MIGDTVSHLGDEGRRVFLDAEHFFEGDGYLAAPDYALEWYGPPPRPARMSWSCAIPTAACFPRTRRGRYRRRHATSARLGIHSHDDTACGVANTLVAVDAGATHVQGTANGYGERSGNADLFSVVAGLQLKRGREVVPRTASRS